MNPCTFVSILLVAFVFGGESLIHGGDSLIHGGEYRVQGGEEHLRKAEANAQKRAVYKKGDHLFNNIAKGFTKMIEDIFQETPIKNFCRASQAGEQFVVEDKLTTDHNKDVTNQFSGMAEAFRKYKTDRQLTTDRDSLSVYGQKHVGPDDNAMQWSANMEDLRRRVFALVNKLIEVQISHGKTQPKEALALQNNLQEKIAQIINRKEYVDQDAKRIFMQDKQNKGKFNLVQQVEQRSKEVLSNLPAKANKWAVEAANFVKKKIIIKN